MIFELPMFTLIHVLLSLAGIIAGLLVVGGLIAGQRLDGWTAVFFVTTVLTNITGFGFPFGTLLPSHIVGVVSLVVLAVALAARYGKQLAGSWRTVFVATTRARALPECLRPAGAALPEDARPDRSGANASRSCVRRHATPCSPAVRGARLGCGEGIWLESCCARNLIRSATRMPRTARVTEAGGGGERV